MKARLDPTGTAKPRTRITARHVAGHCVSPGKGAEGYVYENVCPGCGQTCEGKCKPRKEGK